MAGKSFKIVHKSTLYHGNEASRKMMISKITQGNRAGTPLSTNSAVIVDPSNIYMGTMTVNDPRVLKVRFLPAFGGYLNQPELATTCDKIYKLVTGGAYKATSYSRVDLLKFFIIQANLFAKLAFADRILSIYGATKYSNKAVKVLQDSMPFQVPANNNNAYADILSLRVEVVNILNELIMPASIPALDRLISYCQHIYCDDIHDKTQFFYLEPFGFYSHLVPNSANNDVEFDALTNHVGTVYDFLFSLKTEIETFKESAFYNAIVPDVEKAFVSAQAWIHTPLYQADPNYDPLKVDFEAVYDVEVVQMIRNGQFIGIPMNDYLNLYENSNEELVQGHSSWTAGNPAAKDIPGILLRPYACTANTPSVDSMKPIDMKGYTDTFLYPGFFIDRIINGEDYPTPDDSLSVILASHLIVSYIPVASFDKRLNVITRCTDILLVDFKFYFGDSTPSQYYIPFDGTITGAGSVTSSTITYSARTEIRKFSVCPIITTFAANLSTHVLSAFEFNVNDIDNLIEIPEVVVRHYTTYSIYGLYGLETIDAGAPSRNHSNDKNKKKSRNRDKNFNNNKDDSKEKENSK